MIPQPRKISRSVCTIAATAALCFVPTLMPGCTSISVSPDCPTLLRVGESAAIRANEENPGAIAQYLWEVVPADAGAFVNRKLKDTRFQAQREGAAVLRLTASDGIYRVVSECAVLIEGIADVAVSLEADPPRILINDPVTLTCTSIGAIPSVDLAIVPIRGELVDLVEISEGVVRFSPSRSGEIEFRCIGRTAEGDESEPVFLTVLVEAAGSGNQNGNGNFDNLNSNDNADSNRNDNGTANSNQNDNGAASNQNVNQNGSVNANQNSGSGVNGGANSNGNSTGAGGNQNDNRRPPK